MFVNEKFLLNFKDCLSGKLLFKVRDWSKGRNK